MKNQELVVVARAAGELHAEILRGKLASAGIPSTLSFDSAGTSLFPTPDTFLGRVRVLVPREFETDALAVLADADDAPVVEDDNSDDPGRDEV